MVLLSIGWPLFFLTLGVLFQLVFTHPLVVISAVVLTALCLGVGAYLHRRTKTHLVRDDTPNTTAAS